MRCFQYYSMSNFINGNTLIQIIHLKYIHQTSSVSYFSFFYKSNSIRSLIFDFHMSFVYPSFLWGFLLLLIPVVIHLFNFRRQRIVLFSDIRLLRQVNESKKSGVKLKDWLLLLLRLLAFSALILAFAQPFIPLKEGQTVSGQNYISVYIDNSLSSQSIGKNGVLLDEALAEMNAWAQKYDVQDHFHLLTNEIKGHQQRFVSRNNFLDFLGQVSPSAITRPLSFMVESQSVLMEDAPGKATGVLVSDFQKETTDLENIALPESNDYILYPLRAQNLNNLFIDSVSFESPVFKTGSSLNLKFRLVNNGDSDIENVPIELIINDKNKGMTTVDVLSGTHQMGEISFTVSENGVQNGVLKIDDEEIIFDDDFYFTFETRNQLNILEINPYLEDVRLKNLFSLDPLYHYEKVSPDNIQQAVLNGKDLIVLNRNANLASGLSSVLKNFVDQGGHLVVIPDEEIDINDYNGFLSAVKAPLIENKGGNAKLKSINMDAEFYKAAFEKEQKNISLPALQKHYLLNTSGALLFMPLIQLDNGKPFLGVCNYGNGKIYIQAAGNEPVFGDWRTSALFTTSYLRMAELSTFQNNLYQNFGNDVVMTLPAWEEKIPESVLLHKNEQEFIKLPVVKKQQQLQILMNGDDVVDFLNEAGFYSIKSDDGTPLLHTAFNYDRKESIMDHYTTEELNEWINDQGWQHVSVYNQDEGVGFAENTLTKPKEFWRILLILGLLFLAGEMLLNKLWKV